MSITKFIMYHKLNYFRIPSVKTPHSSKSSDRKHQFKIELNESNLIKINDLICINFAMAISGIIPSFRVPAKIRKLTFLVGFSARCRGCYIAVPTEQR